MSEEAPSERVAPLLLPRAAGEAKSFPRPQRGDARQVAVHLALAAGYAPGESRSVRGGVYGAS